MTTTTKIVGNTFAVNSTEFVQFNSVTESGVLNNVEGTSFIVSLFNMFNILKVNQASIDDIMKAHQGKMLNPLNIIFKNVTADEFFSYFPV